MRRRPSARWTSPLRRGGSRRGIRRPNRRSSAVSRAAFSRRWLRRSSRAAPTSPDHGEAPRASPASPGTPRRSLRGWPPGIPCSVAEWRCSCRRSTPSRQPAAVGRILGTVPSRDVRSRLPPVDPDELFRNRGQRQRKRRSAVVPPLDRQIRGREQERVSVARDEHPLGEKPLELQRSSIFSCSVGGLTFAGESNRGDRGGECRGGCRRVGPAYLRRIAESDGDERASRSGPPRHRR
jgi:hypothetical protein